jgi:LysR family transcriptional regulator for bpeEF and oprC
VGVTADGAEYREHCRRILADLETADEALKRTRVRPQGRLRVDVPEAFGRHLLIPALPKFTARYPDLQLEVQFNDRVIDLIGEQVDVAVRVGAVKSPNLIARRIVNTRLLTCASPDYLQEYGEPTELKQLRDHKLIGYSSANGRRPWKWTFQKGADHRDVAFRFNVAFNSAEARILAAVKGVGIVQSMDLLLAEALSNGRLRAILKDWSAEGAPISIVYPAVLRESAKVRAFSEFAGGILLDYRRYVDKILARRA